jgi:hypothetical protein
MNESFACTCHVSNLRCKNSKCIALINERANFKEKVFDITLSKMKILKENGFTKKEVVRALRREVKHVNNLQFDLFDEAAKLIWREE